MQGHEDKRVLGVQGKSISTAALGYVSERLPSQKQTSMLQVKGYRAVKGKLLMLQTLKHRATCVPFISLWIM